MRKSFADFVKEVEAKNKKKKPLRTRVDIRGTLMAKRNTRVAIREAALRGVSCIFLYKKVTTNEVKRYEVIPTEYKYKKLRAGWRKVLYIQDVREKKQIKLFVVRNILKVALTERRPTSMWPIKIV